jgi:hypothetical protein
MEPILCYTKGCWAYFTTQKLSEQWGDDWNDAPYEYNAGLPYESEDGSWAITKIAWDGPFETPADIGHSSGLSVEEINSGKSPWLKTAKWGWELYPINVMAGTTLTEFTRLIESAGGAVHLKKQNTGVL